MTHTPTLKGLAIAAVLATGVGLLLRTEKGQEIKDDMMEQAKHLAKQFKKTRKEVQEEVQKIFGDLSDELEEDYLAVQAHLLAEIDDLKDKKDLTKEKFGDMVDTVVDKFSESREWTKDAIHKLQSSLKKDWTQLRSSQPSSSCPFSISSLSFF